MLLLESCFTRFFGAPKQMFKLSRKKIITILRPNFWGLTLSSIDEKSNFTNQEHKVWKLMNVWFVFKPFGSEALNIIYWLRVGKKWAGPFLPLVTFERTLKGPTKLWTLKCKYFLIYYIFTYVLVLKRTIPLRRFFWVPTAYVLV